MKLLFIGGGNMATALIGGLVERGIPAGDVRIVEPSNEARARLGQRFPGIALLEATAPHAVSGVALAVLAVKPQQMREAAAALAPHVHAVPVVLSIAAGIRSADLSRWLGGYRRLVRAMPNTPALVGAGISGAFADENVDAAGRARAAQVLEAGGEVMWVPREEALDAVTGVSGSGPAYVFYFLEGLERAALELGFPEADARRLAYATFAGSMRLALSSDAPPATLRQQVTSKGGTTERAIASLEADRVQEAFIRAVKAAALRARELGDALGKDA
jgi:pyrroline-5-carboxylate reductase